MDLTAIKPLVTAEAARVIDPGQALDAVTSADASTAGSPPTATSDTFREILAHYDVTQITPREFSELIQKLHAAGAVDDEQYRELSLVRVDLDAARIDADEPVDLLGFYADRLREQQGELQRLAGRAKKHPEVTANIDTALADTRARLAWIEKFARVASGVDGGVDIVV